MKYRMLSLTLLLGLILSQVSCGLARNAVGRTTRLLTSPIRAAVRTVTSVETPEAIKSKPADVYQTGELTIQQG